MLAEAAGSHIFLPHLTSESSVDHIPGQLISRDLQFFKAPIRVVQFRELAYYAAEKLISNQEPNGLNKASVGRSDDSFFEGNVWVKDHVRASRPILDPLVREHLPELQRDLAEFYLKSTKGILNTLGQPAPYARFLSRPCGEDGQGYRKLDDQFAPVIKYNRFGETIYDWGHNQPDNWGTLLLEVGKGIEQGFPVLEHTEGEVLPAGQVIQRVASYAANLRTERLICRSIWEHDNCWSSYSTRSIVQGGLEKMAQVWGELEYDSRDRGYHLEISQIEVEDSVASLSALRKEHFPADYTDLNHPSTADLASLIVLNDLEVEDTEKREIIDRAKKLRNGVGFYRYIGDKWKFGTAESKWTLGITVLGRNNII
jgi:hypothetical protein